VPSLEVGEHPGIANTCRAVEASLDPIQPDGSQPTAYAGGVTSAPSAVPKAASSRRRGPPSVWRRYRLASRCADLTQDKWLAFHEEAMAGDYDHLLRMTMTWFDVE